MLAGPLFTRETLIAPRQVSHFLARAAYLAAMLVLVYTAVQTTFGWQDVRNPSQISMFGRFVFQILSLVQTALMLFFGAIFSAGHVSQEKDRRTLVLLLMTDLSNPELVLGKLFGSLLMPAVLWAISIPVFGLVYLLGGVAREQIFGALMITLATGLASGAWGNLVAYWREKTFQTLSITLMGMVLLIAFAEIGSLVFGSTTMVGAHLAALDPFHALVWLFDPFQARSAVIGGNLAAVSVIQFSLLALACSGISIARIRYWNPNRFVYESTSTEGDSLSKVRDSRKVWESPVLWREMCTFAYGRKTVLIKLAFLALAGMLINDLYWHPDATLRVLGMVTWGGGVFIGLSLLTLMLVNAQAVTSITNERDMATLDLIVVTEISAREFVFSKLAGILYNAKELLAVPILLIVLFVIWNEISVEHAVYLLIGFCSLTFFATVLGIHSGLTYGISRVAIANSLGTMFFLFVGIFICMLLILQARSSFALQLPSFLVFILGGSLGLWQSLTHRNPSPALGLAAGILPFCTFYAITSYLLGQTLGVCLFISAAYGFTAYAMLVPAISGFDVALGESTSDKS